MNIQINFGTGVTTLPTAALASLDRATKADIKLLLALCAEPGLTASGDRSACLARISQRVGCTEAQAEASLAFWRGVGILNVEEEDRCDGEELPAAAAPSVETPAASAEPARDGGSPEALADTAAETPADTAAETPADTAAEIPAVKITRSATRMLDEIPNYTAVELQDFYAKREDTSRFITECQEIWGNVFTNRDLAVVVALVDQWGFSWEYVVCLIAAAEKHFRERENQGKTLNYVYRTAVSYHKEGILTLEALQQKFLEQEKMAEFEKRIRSMFGLGARNLTPREKKYFSAWLYEYQFDIEAVEMAYNITVDAKGAPNLNYTNGILKHWYEDGLRTVEDIVAKREADESTLRSIREGDLTPDTAKRAVEAALQERPAAEGGEATVSFSRDAGILRRLMNLGNRLLTEGELAAMARWRQEYGFRYEIIYRAYQITLQNRGEYGLPYMDAILRKWHEAKLTTVEAINAYEQGFREEKNRSRRAAAAAPALQSSSFDTDDFFMAAVKRSFGEDFDPDILKQ